MKPDTFDNAYSRIRVATQTRTQTEVAKLLGIKQSSISDAKKKNTVPDGWLITLYRACGLEPRLDSLRSRTCLAQRRRCSSRRRV